MYTEAQKKATMKYEKGNIKRVVIKLNVNTDADLIEYVEKTDNVNAEVKRLMRARVDSNIFTNQQMNLIRGCIDMRVNSLDDYIEELSVQIKPSPIEQARKHQEQVEGRRKSELKRVTKELEELKALRKYIDTAMI